MLRYKTETRPGLVALYDIRPGNGAGPFLQPWSPHGAVIEMTKIIINSIIKLLIGVCLSSLCPELIQVLAPHRSSKESLATAGLRFAYRQDRRHPSCQPINSVKALKE